MAIDEATPQDWDRVGSIHRLFRAAVNAGPDALRDFIRSGVGDNRHLSYVRQAVDELCAQVAERR